MKMQQHFIILSVLLAASIVEVRCYHLIVGDPGNHKQLIYHTVAEYSAIPLTKRVKEVFYSNTDGKNITSIMAYDKLLSKASATVTAGGVGFTYVNLRLKSERGKGLSYDIGIYS